MHLVWRKYPRNNNYPEGITTKNSSSTQMEESSSVALLKSFIVGNSLALDIDNNSTTDNRRELLYRDYSASNSYSRSSGWSTNDSGSSQRPTDSSQKTTPKSPTDSSRIKVGTVKSFFPFLHCGYITVDCSNVDVPFHLSSPIPFHSSSFSPGERVIFSLDRDTLGKQHKLSKFFLLLIQVLSNP